MTKTMGPFPHFLVCFGLRILMLIPPAVSGTDVLRPRGVSLVKASLYDASKQAFTCFDGSNKIPFAYVNDDYCDCHDASDEPGTAACAQGQFHCNNRGYRSFDIPSSRVSDAICDCCDGSDEYEQKVHCPDTCMEMGKQMREDAERQLAVLRIGYQKRLEMIEAVKNRKNEKSTALTSLEAQVKDLEEQKEQYTQAKEAAEEPEKAAIARHKEAWESFKKEQEELRERSAAEEAYKFFAPDSGPLQPETLLSKLVKEGESLSDDLQQFLKGLTDVNVAKFVGEVWPKIKTVFAALKKDTSTAPPPVPTAKDEETHETEKHDHLLDPYDEEERSLDDEHDDSDKNAAIPLDQDRMPDYDQETKNLIAIADKARREYTDFDLKVFNVNEEKKAIQKWLENDYGPDYVFAALENNCYEYSDREYTYKFCAFDKVNQKPKDGGSETGLGKWGNWENNYKVMKYTDGARCWNGPSRSTKVRLTCGAENQLVSASEPSRCEYEMEFQTPTVCSEPPQNVSAQLDLHDEL